jgi:protein-disulfide isomerase
MVKTTTIATLGLLALTALTAAPAKADPLRSVAGFSKLSRGEQATTRAVLSAQACYAPGHQAKLAAGLQRRPPCKTARRIARYVVFLAGKGLTPAQIGKVLTLRRETIHPKKIHSIATVGAPRLGDPKAPVVIVEYADYQCPHCAQVGPLLEKLVRKLKGKAVLYLKPYPLRFSGGRLLAARAALAAQRQGKFWSVSKRLFARPKDHTPAGVEAIAKEAGCDLPRFRAALKDVNLAKQLERNKIEGLRLGVKGTPALFFNGKRYRLRKDAMHFAERVDEELELAHK